jgi:hypothetical protein
MKYIKLYEEWNITNGNEYSIITGKKSVVLKERSIENMMLNEALKLQLNKNNNLLYVVSDLEGKMGSKETFSNKNILSKNGFKWNGTHWTIPSDKFESAKSTLSLINKAEYIIDSLEEIEEMLDDAEFDKKKILKARISSYVQDLANATDEATLSEEIRRYLDFFSKFHSYSYFNRILIYIQKPDATRVASYKKWQEKDRQVKKGSVGIGVFVPLFNKYNVSKQQNQTDDIDALGTSDDETETRKILSGYRIGYVYDISDTEATSPKGEIPDVPQWWGENTPSETADELFGYVSQVVSDMGIKITSEDAKGGERGFAAGDHINISSGVQGVGRISTMIHEIAHELMHFREKSLFYQGEIMDLTKEIKELQAESVSYVVLKHYDLSVSHHPTYLALWNANKELIQSNLEVISNVSQFIINQIDKYAERENQGSDDNREIVMG